MTRNAILTIIVLGGLVKAGIDLTISKQKDESRKYDEWENRRTDILSEFINVYSEFYSLRKLYHSALSKRNSIYDPGTQDFEKLIRDILKKAVDLEGRYGGLKVSIIRHFRLPSGDYGYKRIDKLVEMRAATDNEREMLRHSMDILGESYDDWRHALEQNRKINVHTELWSTYEEILDFLESTRFQTIG